MTDDDTGWPYWSVDIPGLDETGAEELLAIARRTGIGNGGTAVDPASFLTLSLDRDTVAAFLRAFDAIRLDRQFPGETDKLIVASILDVMQEWIATASAS